MSPQKIKRLIVSTPQGESGALDRESRYVFNYSTGDHSCEVSLTMPIRAESYASTTLLPVFAMNQPEGWLYRQIVERMAKHETIDDMKLLSIVGGNQVGRLTFALPGESRSRPKPQVGRDELLTREPTRALFNFLVETYFESGISGVQPKVMIPDAEKPLPHRATVAQSDLIVKSGGDEFPFLTQNEFLCMDAARRAGIRVPNFWLSNDGGLFVMERFDLNEGRSFGFEDMAVLMGKAPDTQGNYKYQGSYEAIARFIQAFCRDGEGLESRQRFFEYVALSVMVRNGDAHLKNFGLLYERPVAASPTLAPLYDVVTTTVYDYVDHRTRRSMVDRTLALKLNKQKTYPSRDELLRFGADICHVRHPAYVIDRIASAMTETLAANRSRVEARFLQHLTQEWDGGRLSVEPNRQYVSTLSLDDASPSDTPDDDSVPKP
ncbi:MAG: type II toxin-antitoxin system HipA family toxin [Gammaproteobacteria bacterium]|nr:type II toxin-antitoxin system HipA family toxin [Gammaproteobacteria bacterium]